METGIADSAVWNTLERPRGGERWYFFFYNARGTRLEGPVFTKSLLT